MERIQGKGKRESSSTYSIFEVKTMQYTEKEKEEKIRESLKNLIIFGNNIIVCNKCKKRIEIMNSGIIYVKDKKIEAYHDECFRNIQNSILSMDMDKAHERLKFINSLIKTLKV